MMFRGLVLSFLVACGSPRAPAQEPRVDTGSATPPAAPPVAVAIVVEGWEMWAGNDQIAEIPEHERYFGALRPFQDAFARVPVTGFPGGSKAAIIAYTDRAAVRAPMAPIESLTAPMFGDQKDYFGVIDRDLVGGVTMGLDELAKSTGRRVLVVIGDGSDTTNDAAKAQLAALAKRAAADNIEIVSIVYRAPLSSDVAVIRSLDPNPLMVNTADGIADQLGWLFARLKDRPVVATVGANSLALVVLVSGWEAWMGNDEIVKANEPDRFVGALASIRAALDRVPKTGFPDGSRAMLATYGSSTQIRFPFGPITSLDGHAIGSQKDYYGGMGIDLVNGVTFAFTELAKAEGRRVLVIIGDGTDTNMDAAKTRLGQLAKQAADLHIEVHAIVYKASLSIPQTVVSALDPNATTVTSSDAITTELVALFERLRKHG
jgi:hypothetical protein